MGDHDRNKPVASGRRTSVATHFRPLLGKPCWGVHYDRPLNLSLKFGDPHLDIQEPYESRSTSEVVRKLFARRLVTVRGRWWLWIYLARWRLMLGDERVVKWTSPKRALANALSDLDGQKLIRVEVDRHTGVTRFDFDLGASLEVWRLRRKDTRKDLWLLYKPNGYVLSVRGDGTCYYRHESQ
jgi:hypothetical protein